MIVIDLDEYRNCRVPKSCRVIRTGDIDQYTQFILENTGSLGVSDTESSEVIAVSLNSIVK